MLRLVTGPFHPVLETHLLQDLRALKARDPFAGAAIVVPSDPLRRSLKRLLARTQGLAWLNVHILTFHQLALQLDRERAVTEPSAAGRPSMTLVSDVVFEQLLRRLGQSGVPTADALRLSQLPDGAWPALWASLRDLKDATVDAAVALHAVEESQFSGEDAEKLTGLFALYAAFQARRQALNLGSYDDLAAQVTADVAGSPFLHSLSTIAYYGSYDLTQTQLTLLERLSAAFSVTVYFPVSDRPGYAFAQRFLERHLYPIVGAGAPSDETEAIDHAASDDPHLSVEVMNAAGAEDELTLVCKQIVDLVETKGYDVESIGVVARDLTAYEPALTRLFDQHGIPFVSSATRALIHEPAVKALLQPARLRSSDLSCSTVMEVLCSPWSRCRLDQARDRSIDPDAWRSAAQAVGIVRGAADWRRLGALTRMEPEALEDLKIDRARLIQLWNAVAPLIEDVARLPMEGTYAEFTEAFLALAERYLAIPLRDEADAQAAPLESAGERREALETVWRQLRDLDRLGERTTWDEWADRLQELCERTTYAVTPVTRRGVQVLDAMAARGIGFRALFVIGLNEKAFPRYIHEDGFLRDRHRLVLSETLGYKIDQKLQGYDEEALLFELLRASASERLLLSYQRADHNGRPLAPSSYVVLPNPDPAVPERSFPRRWSERVGLSLWTPALQTREELTISRAGQGRPIANVLEETGREGGLFTHGMAAQEQMEREGIILTPFDGQIAADGTHWARVSQCGLSPTLLEVYARCPFQYFVGQVLGVRPARSLPTREPAPLAMGRLCHDALRIGYQAVIRQDRPDTLLPEETVAGVLRTAVLQACANHAALYGTGYALLWEMAQEQIGRLVEAVFAADRDAAAGDGFFPWHCEIDATGHLPIGRGAEAVAVHGRWDRVDRRPADGALRVIDYKYRANSRLEGQDRNLLQAALRASILQPPLYALMTPLSDSTQAAVPMPTEVEFVYLLPQGTPTVERAIFDAAAWSGPTGESLKATVRLLVEGIRAGHHVMIEGNYCDNCDVAPACRRRHQPSLWRATRTSQVTPLLEIRSKRVNRG